MPPAGDQDQDYRTLTGVLIILVLTELRLLPHHRDFICLLSTSTNNTEQPMLAV